MGKQAAKTSDRNLVNFSHLNCVDRTWLQSQTDQMKNHNLNCIPTESGKGEHCEHNQVRPKFSLLYNSFSLSAFVLPLPLPLLMPLQNKLKLHDR